jgi:outer membrane murein-binding lipoprotein Lpp
MLGRKPHLFAVVVSALALQGCLARTAVDVVTLPVKVASAGVDAVTTSQSEADQKRGREIRRREERLGELRRDYDRQMSRCGDGEQRACNEARITYGEMQQIMPSVPVEPER